jgi:hypothetical protein
MSQLLFSATSKLDWCPTNPRRYYGTKELHFITCSCYHRSQIRLHTGKKQHQACRSRRISAESTKKPRPMLSGMMPKAAAIQASDSALAMSANVSM